MFRLINKYDKRNVLQFETVFVPVYHVVCGRAFRMWIFQTFIYSPFSETVSTEIHRLWGSSFFWKCSKLNVDFTNEDKSWEKGLSFWYSRIWIRCVKLSLLSREYLSSVVNVLTNSLKILHRTNIDFFQATYFQRDQ